MTVRLRAAVVRRPSLPLTERDEQELAALREHRTHLHVLEQLSGVPVTGGTSEAALLHAVFQAGLAAVREAAEEAGYAEIAAASADRAPEARAAARRRRPTWADEA
ncbi:MAG TPA: hypothetical protein VLC50_00840 [Actinomycetes bacterium]|nr:hypothetical protein [Actinomycetes bacterium]